MKIIFSALVMFTLAIGAPSSSHAAEAKAPAKPARGKGRTTQAIEIETFVQAAEIPFLLLPISWAAAAIVRSDHVEEAKLHRSTRAVDAIDAAIVGLSMLLLLSIPAFHLSGATLDDTTTLVTMLYPVTDAVVLTLILRSIARNRTDRAPFSLVAAAIATFGLADLAYLCVSQFSIEDRSLSDASWIGAVWTAAFLLLGVTACRAWPGPTWAARSPWRP